VRRTVIVICILALTPVAAGASLVSLVARAQDAAAIELAFSAQTAAETYATDHGGSFVGLSPAVLHRYLGSIQLGAGGGHAYLARRGSVIVLGGGSDYRITAMSASGDTFTVNRGLRHTCHGSASPRCQHGRF
jgi:hypothetical protein